jgi:hypothetical protein
MYTLYKNFIQSVVAKSMAFKKDNIYWLYIELNPAKPISIIEMEHNEQPYTVILLAAHY